jgi:hypothetical protein
VTSVTSRRGSIGIDLEEHGRRIDGRKLWSTDQEAETMSKMPLGMSQNPEAFEPREVTDHDHHEGHDHEHGDGCGHEAIEHDDHVDYVHDGHRHWFHLGHWDEH